MKYLCCINRYNPKPCGLDLITVAKISSTFMFLVQMSLLLSFCFLRIGFATYVLGVLKLVGFACTLISLFKKNRLFANIGYTTLQVSIFMQFIFVTLLPAMIPTVFKYAPSNIIFTIMYYEVVLIFQLCFEVVFGYYIFSYMKIHIESKVARVVMHPSTATTNTIVLTEQLTPDVYS
jgi:hypothetical protein